MENQQTQENQTTEVFDATKNKKEAIKAFLYAAGSLALGIGLYFFFDYLEQEGGNVRMNAIIVLAYEFLGKNGVLGLFGVVAALFTWNGIFLLRKKS